MKTADRNTALNATIKLYPTKDAALKMSHPTHGMITREGTEWPNDVVTYRAIKSGAVTVDQPKGDKKEETKVEKVEPKAEDKIEDRKAK